MTTVSGPVTDVLIEADADYWVFTSRIRAFGTGVITERERHVKPVAGVLTIDLPPGPIRITVGSQTFDAQVPDADCTLAELVEASLTYPPNTPQTLLNAAVANVLGNPAESGPLTSAFVRFVDQNGDPLPPGSLTTIHVNTVTGEVDDITFEEG